MIPGSFWQLTAYPTLLAFKNLYTQKSFEVALDLEGPIRNFTLEQDLERGEVHLFGESVQGYFRLVISRNEKGIELLFQKTPSGGISYRIDKEEGSAEPKTARLIPLEKEHAPVSPPEARLSLGVHKAQDWDLVMRRGNVEEILPFWMRLAEWLPEMRGEAPSVGSLRLLDECTKKSKEEILPGLQKAFLAGFSGILCPRLEDADHQGILPKEKIPSNLSPLFFLKRGGESLRSLFVREEGEELFLLPCLPPQFSAGRLVHLRLHNGDLLDLEWSKKLLRRVIIRPQASREVLLSLQKPITRFRVRHSEKERGKVMQREKKLFLEAETTLFLDRFEK